MSRWATQTGLKGLISIHTSTLHIVLRTVHPISRVERSQMTRWWYSGRSVRMTSRSVHAYILISAVSSLHIQIVGLESIIGTTPDGKTISATFGSLDGES